MIHDTLRDMLDIDELAYPQLRFLTSHKKYRRLRQSKLSGKRLSLFMYGLKGVKAKNRREFDIVTSEMVPFLRFASHRTIMHTPLGKVCMHNGITRPLMIHDIVERKYSRHLCGFVPSDCCGRNKAKLRHLVWYECGDEIPLNGE